MAVYATYGVFIDWNNDGDYGDTGETITSRVLPLRQPISIKYGRDEARSLSAIRPGETAFTVNNTSLDYSPDNASSPLVGNLEPGKPVLIQATFSAVTYDIFRGFLDGYELKPGGGSDVGTVEFTGLDLLHKLQEAVLSTPVYEALQTGEAIHALLDAVGWPTAARDIDQGASSIRWWWEEGTNGLDALNKIVDTEGPAAFAYVDSAGSMVFRDRHHRFKTAASKTVQDTYDATEFSGIEYEAGWKDLINQVIIDVQEREPATVEVVWSTEVPFNLAAGESRVFDVKAEADPFFNAITPVAGPDGWPVDDIELSLGTFGNVTAQLSRDSGQSCQVTVSSTTAVTVKRVQVRAQPIPVARTVKVTAEDPASIERHGVRTSQDITPDWANANDAYAIARVIVAQRHTRLPVVHITFKNRTTAILTQMLSRDLSDRIHITETETGLDDDFFIENIEHSINEAGKLHTTTFGCEKVVVNAASSPNYLTFDKAGSGFTDGVFGEDGQVQSTLLFVLDDAGTNGQLDVAGLGY